MSGAMADATSRKPRCGLPAIRWIRTARSRPRNGNASMVETLQRVLPGARQHDRQIGLRHQQRTMPTDSQLNLCSFVRGRCAPHVRAGPRGAPLPLRLGPSKPPAPPRRLSRVCAAGPPQHQRRPEPAGLRPRLRERRTVATRSSRATLAEPCRVAGTIEAKDCYDACHDLG